MLNKFFRIRERGSSVKTEIIGGVTTFFSLCYILVVNPSILSQTGMDYNAVVIGTCLASALGCFLTAFLANAPFAQSIGLGLNSMFTYTLCMGMNYTWQQSAAIVFISGLIFLTIMISPIRKKIISSLPLSIRSAIGAGIGLFICFIALFNAGIIVTGDGYTDLGIIGSGAPLLAIIGIIITALLMVFKVKGAIFIGIILTTLIGIPLGVTTIPENFTLTGASIAPLFCKMQFNGLLSYGVLPLISVIITFAIVDTFDSVGTLSAASSISNIYDENGALINNDKALLADAIATCTGAGLFSMSTTTTFVESVNGIAYGARTGLSSVVVGLLFLLSCIIAPVMGIVPSAAVAPALIMVGVLMMKNVIKIHWDDLEEAIPCFLTIIMMPFSYSISDGIGWGIISYVIIKLARGKAKTVPVLMYILAAMFIAMYVLSAM